MLRRVLVAAVFVVPIARAHAQTPAPNADEAATLTDDSDDEDTDDSDGDKPDDKSDDEDSDADARAQAEHSDDDLDEREGEPARVEHEADDEDEGHSHHEPGLGLEWIASRARLRLGLIVQPMARYGHDSIPSPDTMDLTIRRARVAFDAELSHGTGFRLELQARDLKIGIADLYGRWALDEHIEIRAGFLHAPGGLERDTNPFDLPFLERSSLASMTRDREVGLELVGHQDSQFWTVSITRDAPSGLGGDDPEFAVNYPHGVDPTAVERSAVTWNQAARVGTAPSDEFAAGFGWTLRIRNSQADYGDPAYEPNGSVFLDPRPYRGTSVRLGADAAVSEPHFRVLMEAAFRRDGQQLSYDAFSGFESRLPGHEWWSGGYLTVGWSPIGGYGRAIDGAPLQWGWELIGRFEVMKVKPVDAFSSTLYAETIGWNWVATRQIRIQVEATLQSFGDFDQTMRMDNAEATRFYADLWATWRL